MTTARFAVIATNTKAVITEIISALLILLFVYAGISKCYERSFFEAQLSFYPLISKIAVQLSWLIPFANLFTAVALLIPKSNRAGFYMALIMLLCYTIYLIIMLITQDDLPCSCGGIIQSLSWKEQVMLNLLLILLTLTALLFGRPFKLIPINKQQIQ